MLKIRKDIEVKMENNRHFKAILDRITGNVNKKATELKVNLYDKYPDNDGSVGIELTENDYIDLQKKIQDYSNSEFKKEFEEDIKLLKELLNSKMWQVFIKYAQQMNFKIESNSYTEKMAFIHAKESAVSTIIALPESLIKFCSMNERKD